MRVYLSVDMEGVTGLTDPEEMHHGGRGYERGCEFMTGDANAVVRGAFAAGATQVLVNDAHGSTRNLRIDRPRPPRHPDPRPGKPHRMAQGLRRGLRRGGLRGLPRARAGVSHGVLNHTWMGKEIQNVALNGEICGETRLVAAYAGFVGVPVALVTGDEAVCEEARDLLGDGRDRARSRRASTCSPPSCCRSRWPSGGSRRGRPGRSNRLADFRPMSVEPPYTLEVEWNSTAIAASACGIIPGTRRNGQGTPSSHTDRLSGDHGPVRDIRHDRRSGRLWKRCVWMTGELSRRALLHGLGAVGGAGTMLAAMGAPGLVPSSQDWTRSRRRSPATSP